MTDRYLLDGIKVVELATFVFGPAAGTILGDFGADVVHIEHPLIGDAYRHLPQLKPLPECADNYCWILTARGKRLLDQMTQAAWRAHARTVDALPPTERAAFLHALARLVDAGNAFGRAPLRLT